MTAIGRLGAISLDTDEPETLASFYKDLLGYDVVFTTEDFIALKGSGSGISVQRVADYVAPDWPGTSVPKQIHLEIAVKDLEDAESAALAIGATKSSFQPNPDTWRVLLDPAGHPFCITTMIPDDY
jgi:hypothetical protein